MMPEPMLVIGVGNPYRRDDGFGLAVLSRLQDLALPGVSIVEESGEPAALIARWSGHPLVIMVDAVSSGAAPGSIHQLECGNGIWDVGSRRSSASTHGLGVADAVELGGLLDQLPARLVILGVETQDVTNGTGLSTRVAAAVDPVVGKIAAMTAAVSGMSATLDNVTGPPQVVVPAGSTSPPSPRTSVTSGTALASPNPEDGST